MVYSISNVNAFILLVTIGFSLYPFLNVKADNDNDLLNDNHKALLDRNNSPIQITSQMKGYFSLNPVLALSLGITLFSFVGIPPLAGFFAKQMVLSAALDSGYVFLALVAILTSVVSAVYYLGVIKQIFFDDYTSSLYASQGGRSTTERGLNLQDTSANSNSSALSAASKLKIREDGSRAHTAAVEDTLLSFSLTVTISILTLALLSFIFTPQESLSMTSILALTLFNP
jgi:NADH-ubiquinone oxidoreductase chain 2